MMRGNELFSILFALLMEQARPLKAGNFLHIQVRKFLSWAVRQFDTGQTQHATLTWSVVVLLPALASALVHWALVLWAGWIAAVVWKCGAALPDFGFSAI